MHYDLAVAARNELSNFINSAPEYVFPVAYESVPFDPHADGSTWLKFDYKEADTVFVGLSRKCKYAVGMVQISIHFAPGLGMDKVRMLARDIAEFFEDGKMLINDCYIVDGGKVHPVQKSVGGWSYPVRFYVRKDKK